MRPDPAPRAVHDRSPERVIIGTAPTVVPELLFDHGEASAVTLRAPSFGGPTRRSMRPHAITIPPGGEQMYASFAVPTIHLGRELLEATMRLEDGTKLSSRRFVRPTTRHVE